MTYIPAPTPARGFSQIISDVLPGSTAITVITSVIVTPTVSGKFRVAMFGEAIGTNSGDEIIVGLGINQNTSIDLALADIILATGSLQCSIGGSVDLDLLPPAIDGVGPGPQVFPVGVAVTLYALIKIPSGRANTGFSANGTFLPAIGCGFYMTVQEVK